MPNPSNPCPTDREYNSPAHVRRKVKNVTSAAGLATVDRNGLELEAPKADGPTLSGRRNESPVEVFRGSRDGIPFPA